MKQVSWSIPARQDVNDLYKFIAVNNPTAALRIVVAIEACADWLGEVPLAGAALHRSNLRTFSVSQTSYTIVYQVTPGPVIIARVHHQSQNWRPQ